MSIVIMSFYCGQRTSLTYRLACHCSEWQEKLSGGEQQDCGLGASILQEDAGQRLSDG